MIIYHLVQVLSWNSPTWPYNAFESRRSEHDTTSFAGINISYPNQYSRTQKKYYERLHRLSTSACFSEFRWARPSLKWAVYAPPQFFCSVIALAQVTEQSFNVECMKQLKKGTNYSARTAGTELTNPQFEDDSLHIRVPVTLHLQTTRISLHNLKIFFSLPTNMTNVMFRIIIEKIANALSDLISALNYYVSQLRFTSRAHYASNTKYFLICTFLSKSLRIRSPCLTLWRKLPHWLCGVSL